MNNPKKQFAPKPHTGGDTEFWQDDWVRQYDRRQALIVEKKQDVLDSMVRILVYFCEKRAAQHPTILDIGCGPGTLSVLLLDKFSTCTVVGVDVSDQMIEAARRNLVSGHGEHFSGHVSDFNSYDFWTPSIDK